MLVNVMIFSCDRPAQLDMLLRSMADLVRIPGRVCVIAKATSQVAAEGYQKIVTMHPGVKVLDQTAGGGFFVTMMSELIPASHFMPLVDDDVFIRPFRKDHPEFGMLNDPGVSSVSLRLGVDITKCYAMGDLATPPPQRDQNGCYDWHGLPGDWGYPMSLDGNLYRANDIYPLITATQADNPNLLEAALSGSPIVRPRICCYDEPRLVNIPHNRVQNVYSNRSMGQEVNELNARFNEGHRLAYEHFEKIRCSTVHAELPLRYLPENYA